MQQFFPSRAAHNKTPAAGQGRCRRPGFSGWVNHDKLLLIITAQSRNAPHASQRRLRYQVAIISYERPPAGAGLFVGRVFDRRLAKTRLGGGGKIINPHNSQPPMSCDRFIILPRYPASPNRFPSRQKDLGLKPENQIPGPIWRRRKDIVTRPARGGSVLQPGFPPEIGNKTRLWRRRKDIDLTAPARRARWNVSSGAANDSCVIVKGRKKPYF